MAKSIEQIEYERDKSRFELEIHKLQTENLILSSENLKISTRQLKRYFLYSIISFITGILSAAIIQYIGKTESRDILRLEQRITALEQTANQLEDSIQTLKVLNTNERDSLKSIEK